MPDSRLIARSQGNNSTLACISPGTGLGYSADIGIDIIDIEELSTFSAQFLTIFSNRVQNQSVFIYARHKCHVYSLDDIYSNHQSVYIGS